MDEKERLLRIYLKSRGKIGKIESYAEAQQYALNLGDAVAAILGDRDFTEVSEDEIAEILRPILKQAQGDAVRAARLAQQAQNRAAGLGIGVLEAEADGAAAAPVAEQLAGKAVTKEFISNIVGEKIIGSVDETARRNIQAQDDMGLTVHIVRKYSDKGLRSGTKYAEPCQWCLSRCGEWDSYQAAKDAGCFERHPGCCCTIDYKNGRTYAKVRGRGPWWTRDENGAWTQGK